MRQKGVHLWGNLLGLAAKGESALVVTGLRRSNVPCGSGNLLDDKKADFLGQGMIGNPLDLEGHFWGAPQHGAKHKQEHPLTDKS